MVDLKRRQLLKAASGLLLTSCAGPLWAADTVTRPAFADKPSFEPLALFLTWQRDPTTTMTVQWIGNEADGASRPIWFAKAGSLDWRQALSTVRPYPMSDRKIFRTELVGLQPGTEYRLRVGLDSAERGFRTMPTKATDAFSFVSGGDSGIGPEAQQINRVAAAQDPMFAVLGGDLAYENGRDGDTFLRFLSNYASQLIDSAGRLVPLVATIGNHEVDGGYAKPRTAASFYYSVFDGLYPDTGHATLDFGDYLSLVLLDSNHTTPVVGEQTSWLASQLHEREERPNVFVFYHVPSYPSFRPFDLDDNEKGTGADSRKHWVPLFERYNVDAVMEHHDHTYKRTHALLDGRADDNGIYYIGDGSWGKLRRPKTTKERPYLKVAHESYHLSLHRIEGRERFHLALSERGKVMDICTTKKRAHT